MSLGALLIASPLAEANSSRFSPQHQGRHVDQRSSSSQQTLSIGYPRRGRLQNAVELRPSRHVRFTNEVAKSGRVWGTQEIIGLVERSAASVADRYGIDTLLFVGDISKRKGGRVPGHNSHQNGRDIDLAYYAVDDSGRAYESLDFVKFGRHGLAFGRHKGVRFDVNKNWELVSNLVSDNTVRVQHIFVSDSVRRRLLHHAKSVDADPVVYNRARRVLTQPSEGHRHDNHFHVRIYCDPSDRPKCKEQVPIFSWYPRDETQLADATSSLTPHTAH